MSILSVTVVLVASCSNDSDGRCAGADCFQEDLSAEAACLPPSASTISDSGEYEYIIVGAGAGGGPLAANLARAGHSVLLLEAGNDPCQILQNQVPAFHALASENPELAWSYFVDHYSDPALATRDSKYTPEGILYPRGTGLGGSTAVNAMITVTPHDSDWDKLASATGDSSWSSGNMKGYFNKVRGWLDVERADPAMALGDQKLIEIVLAAGLTYDQSQSQGTLLGQLFGLLSRDLTQTPAQEGLYNIPLATQEGRRHGVREYVIDTVLDGYPLTVKTGAFVTNVVFADTAEADGTPRVSGVSFIEGENLYQAGLKAPDIPSESRVVNATREVILSAGTFNTPQILKLSGIGPAEELQAMGIDLAVDLPGVGENMQDRYEVGIVHQTRRDFDLIRNCTFGEAGDPCLEAWADGNGVYTSSGSTVSIVRKSSPELEEPDLFIFGAPADFRGYYPGYSEDGVADRRSFTWLILEAHTENRAGSVTLASTDPRDTPHIDFSYFQEGSTNTGQDQRDLDAMVNGVQFVRDIAQETRDVQFLFPAFNEVWPGDDVDEVEEIEQFVKDEAWGHHACCTSKMGGDDDPMAVLDSRFRVRGTSGLRVVDASIFPEIPGFFIAAPIYMISEKATDTLLEEIGESR
ncbi:MAG: GMC family oxidoreductase N-terminal domain-containing protein [Deltaproteobacteria bacterium]|nr:GMC family oxidoreductase N-terminal domain-containing protein [Deltaproteobacteria bacterium]